MELKVFLVLFGVQEKLLEIDLPIFVQIMLQKFLKEQKSFLPCEFILSQWRQKNNDDYSYKVDVKKITGTCSRLVWANGRAAGIRRTIPVRSIWRLPLLEALPSLPLLIWKSRQSFQNKMAEAVIET